MFKQNLYTNVHSSIVLFFFNLLFYSSIICNRPKLETTWLSLCRWGISLVRWSVILPDNEKE
jgi:hypothetical protein